MDNSVDNFSLRSKISKIYYLTCIAIFSAIIQWCLLVNFEFLEFLINPWVIFGAYITFIFIISVLSIADCWDITLPDVVEWIFVVLLLEIVVIALSAIVDYVDQTVLYISLIVILICMIVLLGFGAKINLDYLPTFVVTVFSANMSLMIMILLLIIISRYFLDIYITAFLSIAIFAYPIFIMNLLYVSLLIHHDRYEIKKLTDCLKPVLYIYGIFGALVWFTLNLCIVIREMM